MEQPCGIISMATNIVSAIFGTKTKNYAHCGSLTMFKYRRILGNVRSIIMIKSNWVASRQC